MSRNYIEELKASAQTIIDNAENIINSQRLWQNITVSISISMDEPSSIEIKSTEVSQHMIDYYQNNS